MQPGQDLLTERIWVGPSVSTLPIGFEPSPLAPLVASDFRHGATVSRIDPVRPSQRQSPAPRGLEVPERRSACVVCSFESDRDTPRRQGRQQAPRATDGGDRRPRRLQNRLRDSSGSVVRARRARPAADGRDRGGSTDQPEVAAVDRANPQGRDPAETEGTEQALEAAAVEFVREHFASEEDLGTRDAVARFLNETAPAGNRLCACGCGRAVRSPRARWFSEACRKRANRRST